MKKKLYVLVDKKLKNEQRWVQGAHAVAQYVMENPGQWENGTLVMLESPDIKTDALGADAVFREPYFNNKITAVAKLSNDKVYINYRLL